MKFRKSMLSASIATALLFAAAAQAQNASPLNQASNTDQQQTQSSKAKAKKAAENQNVTTLGAVQVVGIRLSQALSLETKKASNSQIEVVSATDIGKLPAKNIPAPRVPKTVPEPQAWRGVGVARQPNPPLPAFFVPTHGRCRWCSRPLAPIRSW